MSKKTDTTALQTVVDLQQRVAKGEAVIADLEKAIAGKKLTLAELQPPSSPKLSELSTQRENALADMVLGKASQTELEKIDLAITDEQARINKSHSNNAGLIADTKQAITGLERKLEQEEAALAELEFNKYRSISGYLTSEAEQIGAEYVLAARATAALHRRLLAVDALINERNRAATINKDRPVKLVIPVFNLAVHNGSESTIRTGEFDDAVNTYHVSNHLAAAIEAERDRIQKNGVSL